VLGWVGAWGDGLWTCGGLGEDLWRWALPCLDWRAQEGVLWASIDVREGEAGDSGGENGTRDRDIG
jgi:hypothetical protein